MKRIRFILFSALAILIGSATQNPAQESTDLQSQIQKFQAGTHQFMLAGYAVTSFIKEEGNPSQFESAFMPIFLFKATDKVFFEGELEIEIEDGAQEMNLEYGQILYLFSDYLIFGAGKFLNPTNYFIERLHPAWINKMPDKPLMVHPGTRMLASQHLGFQLRGAVPIKGSKIEYSFFVGMGPVLDPATGEVTFTNYGDNNDNKSIGGRIGFIPIPKFEIGYGFEVAKVGDANTNLESVKAINNVVDFSYAKEIKGLKGGVDLKAQLVWLNIDNPNIAPLIYSNDSFGGYAQISFRPYNSPSEFFQNLEFVYRYDWSDKPNKAPSNEYIKRSGFGINYWLTSSSLFKFAYETSNIDLPNGSTTNEHRFIGQVAFGF
ncbi:MAG TPA: hypothetical protein ENI57_06075 [Ignavibacteria bacterium]|nr:hypothetical protein [Ignavibacteria bacterium]